MTTKVQLQYVLIPHPDDEFEGWALIEGSTDNYPVFILLTQGEQTGFADGHGLDTSKGERVPQPQPFHGRGSLFIRAQRLDSWHTFLDGMAERDATLDRPPFAAHLASTVEGAAVRSREFDVFIGDDTARVVFDLGDGQLTAAAVGFALRTVRQLVRPLLPLQREYGVIGASYYNAVYPGLVYTHPDHRAVHEALWHTDFGLPGPQWGRTTHSDPDAAAPNGRTAAVTPATYAAVMALGPNQERVGIAQQAYGWLAFEPPGYWTAGPADTDDGAISRVQTFWQRF